MFNIISNITIVIVIYQIGCFFHEFNIDTWQNKPPGASHIVGVWERQIRSKRTILEGLMKTYCYVLNNESLRTLMGEVELIINLKPLNLETISDSKSQIQLSPSSLLTMKTNVVMPPSCEFSKPDVCSQRR